MTLATCAKDVKFYKWPNICYVGIYETPFDCMTVKNISWSCTGKELLVVKSKGNPVIILPPSVPEQYIEDHNNIHVNNASVGTFSNTNPNLLAFGTDSGAVLVYNIKSKQKLSHEFKHLPSGIQNLEFSSDDQSVAAGCINGQIFVFDSKFRPSVSFMIPNSLTLSTVTYSKFTPNLMAAGSREGILSLWDTETSDGVLYNKNHNSRITDIAFFGNMLSTVGVDGNFITYDLRSCSCHSSFELDCSLSSVAFIPDSYIMAISTTSGQLRSYDLRNMKTPLRTLVANSNGGIKKISFPNVKDETAVHTTLYHKIPHHKNFEDDFSASGDFSIVTDSSARLSHVYEKQKKLAMSPLACEEAVGNSISSVEVIASPRKSRKPELEEIIKTIEDKIKNSSKEFEERLVQAFYCLRIDTSKRFIGLEDKISRSWSSFVDYLRLSGATSVYNSVERVSKEDLVQVENDSDCGDNV